MQTNHTHVVPIGTDDPIQHLLDGGEEIISLATTWGFKSTDSVYRLKRFAHVPPAERAELMGRSFGWTPGQVIEHWMKRVKR